MKKTISLVLAATILFSLAVPAFAANECSCETLPVVYVPGFGTSIYQNPGEEMKSLFFLPSRKQSMRLCRISSKPLLQVSFSADMKPSALSQ